MTRPAERYRWSSYRNYVGGPAAVDWVDTGEVLEAFGGNRGAYRAYVESGKGQKAVNPFERAVAGLVLGGDEFVGRVRKLLRGRRATADEPSIAGLRRSGKADPRRVEEAVARIFAAEGPARRRRLLLYAQRLHSRLSPADIARRYDRTRAAVTLAARDLAAEAKRNPRLAAGLAALSRVLGDGETEH